MSHSQSAKYLTEIQTLSLLPNHKIGSWSSQSRKALQTGLRITASHPKCDGIYWLLKKEDPQKIVIICKWKEAVDFTTARSYLRPLLVYLESPPPRTIHVNYAFHSFSTYSIDNFLTVYFPISKCSSAFKAHISANVDAFINAMEPKYTNPYNLRFVASGWIKETKIVNGEVANGFMFCLMWTNPKSEARYKNENEHWRVFMQRLKGMGMLDEEQFHGKAYQVHGEGQREQFEFLDESSDDGNEADEGFASRRERLKDTMYWKFAETDLDATSVRDRIGLLNRHKVPAADTKEELCLTNWCAEEPKQATDCSSDAGSSLPSTPILTPSSSTMSLNSLFNDTKPFGALPGTWKSEYDICRPQSPLSEEDPLSGPYPTPVVKEAPAPFWLPVCQIRRPSFGDAESKKVDCGKTNQGKLTDRVISLPISASDELPKMDPVVTKQLCNIFSDIPCATSTSEDETAMRRQWNPEEELLNAKSRFWRRRRQFYPSRLETQRAKLRSRSLSLLPLPPAQHNFTPEHHLTIDPLRNVGRKDMSSTWWSYIRECLSDTAATSITSTDVETGGTGIWTQCVGKRQLPLTVQSDGVETIST